VAEEVQQLKKDLKEIETLTEQVEWKLATEVQELNRRLSLEVNCREKLQMSFEKSLVVIEHLTKELELLKISTAGPPNSDLLRKNNNESVQSVSECVHDIGREIDEMNETLSEQRMKTKKVGISPYVTDCHGANDFQKILENIGQLREFVVENNSQMLQEFQQLSSRIK